MNLEQLLALVRAGLYIASSIAVTFGVMTADDTTKISGGVVTIITTGWTIWASSRNSLIAKAAAQKSVEKIITKDDKTANAIPTNKVVSLNETLTDLASKLGPLLKRVE